MYAPFDPTDANQMDPKFPCFKFCAFTTIFKDDVGNVWKKLIVYNGTQLLQHR